MCLGFVKKLIPFFWTTNISSFSKASIHSTFLLHNYVLKEFRQQLRDFVSLGVTENSLDPAVSKNLIQWNEDGWCVCFDEFYLFSCRKFKVPAKLLLVCLSLKVSSFGAAGLFWSGEWQNKENFNGEEIVS